MCENIEKICIYDNYHRSFDSDIDFLKFTIGVLKLRKNNKLEVRMNECVVRITPNESSNNSVDNLLLFEIFDREKKPCHSTSDEKRLPSLIHNLYVE